MVYNEQVKNNITVMDNTIKYDEFVKLISNGDTFFITTPFNLMKIHTYLSYIIRKIAKTPNHCAVYFDGSLYGAKQQGVTKLPLYDEIKGQYVTVKRKIGDDVVEKKRWCEKMLGRKYDVKSLIWYELLLYITGKWYGKTGADAENEFFCYEYGADANIYERHDRIIGQEFFGWVKFRTVVENAMVIE